MTCFSQAAVVLPSGRVQVPLMGQGAYFLREPGAARWSAVEDWPEGGAGGFLELWEIEKS